MDKMLFIVTGPSGAGKNTVMTHITETFPQIRKAVTYTTREPRPHELDGVDYRFIGEEEFFTKVKDGAILEYEQVYNDYYYGSPADIFTDGNFKIMEMDWKGHRRYREVYKEVTIISLFLVPPSLAEIQKRILERSQVNNLGSRIANALEQLEHADEYSYIIVNDQREKMLENVEAIVRTEIINSNRRHNLELVRNLINQYKN